MLCTNSCGLRVDNPDLYDRIGGCNQWPVEVQLADVDGHTTAGRVVARVVR
jgi:hypothetical protein